MIGALIADIAAWTYEHDKDMFLRELIPDNAMVVERSVYMRALSDALNVCKGEPREGVIYDWNSDWTRYCGQAIMWNLAGRMTGRCIEMPTFHSIEKDCYYTALFIQELRDALRNGATKSQAYHSVNMFEGLSKHPAWKKPIANTTSDMLTYVFRAWDCFYRAFDYTSTIHNAMRWDGDRHLTAIIAGLFAEAMYGCEYSMIKSKYVKDGDTPFHSLSNKLGKSIFTSEEFENRKFFKKNDALTNVEKHKWTTSYNPVKCKDFSTEEYETILRSHITGWEQRYGLYLDDGWMYVYRSHVLLGRFQMKEDNGRWKVINTQLSEEKSWASFCIGLYEVLRCTLTVNITTLGLLKYYNGEEESPFSSDDVRSKFWHGEMMFVTNQIDISEWAEHAKKTRVQLNDKAQNRASIFSDTQLGLILYIETLFAKWCPYDDLDWVWEY